MSDEEAPAATVTKPEPDPSIEVLRLAGLSAIEYDRERETAAKTLGIRTSTLDEQVREAKREQHSDSDIEVLDPWPDPVDGAELAEAVRSTVVRYVVVENGLDVALTLWVLGSYSYDSFRIFPKLLVTAATKRAGKTTLIEVLESVCRSSILASGMSAAVLYRVLDKWHPTLLLDEIDAWLRDNEEARGIVNAGHTRRTAFVYRCVGDDHTPTRFSVWGPMTLAGIGKPADTIRDRSIEITLKRKLTTEKCERIPVDLFERCHDLRRKAERWYQDNAAGLTAADPDVPAVGNDRAEDNWRPLLAMADLIGWSDKARSVFLSLHQADAEEDDGIISMLLEDIRAVFTTDRMHSADLVAALHDLEDRPWSTWHRGKPLTQNGLARLLKDLRIRPCDLRIGITVKKGYERFQFEDAFRRLLPDTPASTATLLQASNGAGFSDIGKRYGDETVAHEIPPKPSNDAGCSGVADETPKREDGPWTDTL
jgi:putative DNA primase/helicase